MAIRGYSKEYKILTNQTRPRKIEAGRKERLTVWGGVVKLKDQNALVHLGGGGGWGDKESTGKGQVSEGEREKKDTWD